ncbi:hypothetical protein WJX82_003393 [Trebouxia sp. C0006]
MPAQEGLNFRVVIPPQANECDPLQTDIAIFRRPAQPSNSLASITDVALQSIFQHLDVASAARLASTCKDCLSRKSSARILELCVASQLARANLDCCNERW